MELLLLREVPVAFKGSPQGSWIFLDLHFSFYGAAGQLEGLLQGTPSSLGQVTTKLTLWERVRVVN